MNFDFVDGSILVPTDMLNSQIRGWTCCNMFVLSWIMNYIAESISYSIIFMKNAIDIYNDLKECHSHGYLVCVSKFQQ